uniref:uncharacterized protein LOC122595642 n=1 Tax=Erigeron canadensis TaxID=72917 RepID=UPI001CB97E8A|nr:uncharacterized protein LOC122595642 [Erigeron canadensis]
MQQITTAPPSAAAAAASSSIDEEITTPPPQPQHEDVIIPVASSSYATSSTPTSNIPRQDLFNGQREVYLSMCVPLYKASVRSDWRSAKAIFDKHPWYVRYSITERNDTALHMAVSGKRSKKVEAFVKNLVDFMEKDDLALINKSKNTALYVAAANGTIAMVKCMVEKNTALLTIPGSGGRLPVYVAALSGNYEMVKYLYEQATKLNDNTFTSRQIRLLFQECVQANMFDIALKIVEDHPEVADNGIVLEALARKPDAFSGKKSNIVRRSINLAFLPESDSEALQLLRIVWGNIAKKPKAEIDDILRGTSHHKSTDRRINQNHKIDSGNVDQVLQLQKLISEHIANMNVETHYIMKGQQASAKEGQALKLQELIFEHTTKMLVKSQNLIREPVVTILSNQNEKPWMASSSDVMFVATEKGNTEFVIELIRQYHDLINKVNENNQTIFHVAVRHRREGIYNLMYEIGSVKDLITFRKDENGNNMLHLAGLCAQKSRLEDVSGAALQMQRELLWFKEVESMMRPSYREQKNKDGLTPHKLFTKEHATLITEGEKWMKETANQCMVVAALIATIVFAAAFTVPGGYDQNDGLPIYYRERSFKVFVVTDAISLFLSSASILTFLSILTSRYAERDFVESLPKKLMLGLATLFLSITTMMIAFSFSFVVLYQKEVKWMPIFICAFAFLPVLLYVALQYHLLVDVFRSTYGSKYLFKPAKEVLFCEPKKA